MRRSRLSIQQETAGNVPSGRVVAASLAAAFSVPFVAALLFLSVYLSPLDSEHHSNEFWLNYALGILNFSPLVAGLTFFHWGIFALVNYVFEVSWKHMRWWSLVGLGFICGWLPLTIISPILQYKSISFDTALMDSMKSFSILGLFGALGGLSFWATWAWLEKR